jgi:hypothetical protein
MSIIDTWQLPASPAPAPAAVVPSSTPQKGVGSPYLELLSAIPQGTFYDPHGTILPYSDGPYAFKLSAQNPNTTYNVVLNGQLINTVTTDASGIALVNVVLARGVNTLTLSNTYIGSSLTSYITTRDWATLLAGIADILGPLDTQAQQLLLDRDLATVGFDRIDTVWGRRLHNDNRLEYATDAYRELLQILQRAYRRYGGKTAGLMEAIGAFTHINPLTFRRDRAPRWVLGNQLIPTPNLDTWSSVLSSTTFPNLSAGGASIKIASNQLRNELGSATLAYNTTTHVFTLTTSNGLVGTSTITPGATSTTIIPRVSPNQAKLWSEIGPFDTLTLNNILLEIDTRGQLAISLTASASLTATSLASAINSALAADARYGAGYNAVAVVSNGRVVISSLTGEIKLHQPATADATHNLFGVPWSYSTTAGSVTPPSTGNFTLSLVSTASFPSLDSENIFSVIIATNPRRMYVVKKNDLVANTLTLYANGDTASITSGTPVYVVGQAPRVRSIPTDDGGESLTLTLTHSELLSNASDTFTISGSTLPTGWWFTTPPASVTVAYKRHAGWMRDGCVQLTNSVNTNTWTINTQLKPRVMQYVGFPITAGAWVARDYTDGTIANFPVTVTVGLSFDGGSTWTTTNQSLAATSARIPTYIGMSTTIPTTAISVLMQISASGFSSTGANVRIEKATARVTSHSGRNLGYGTIPRNQHRSKRDYMCYLWSPTQLTSARQSLLGLMSGTKGHIDSVTPAHAHISRFDVTEYTGGTPLNLAGMLSGSDLFNCVLTNMSLIVRSPATSTYVQPILSSDVVGETLSFDPITHIATTQSSPTIDQTTCIVYEGGVPLTTDTWTLTNGIITLLFQPDSTLVYTADYQRLTRLETPVVTMPANYTDYTWYGDVFHILGFDFTPSSVPVTNGIQFDGNYIATLIERSDRDQSTSTLMADDGIQPEAVDVANWQYVSAQSVRIDPAVFNPVAVYTMTYNARVAHPRPRPTAMVEYRQGASLVACQAASYVPLTINQPVAPAPYVQFRITYGNVIDPAEIRLYTVSLKGLNTQGVSGTIPVLRNRVWVPIPLDGVP